jgi:hypothetical protein
MFRYPKMSEISEEETQEGNESKRGRGRNWTMEETYM